MLPPRELSLRIVYISRVTSSSRVLISGTTQHLLLSGKAHVPFCKWRKWNVRFSQQNFTLGKCPEIWRGKLETWPNVDGKGAVASRWQAQPCWSFWGEDLCSIFRSQFFTPAFDLHPTVDPGGWLLKLIHILKQTGLHLLFLFLKWAFLCLP